ncbi:DNA-directed RNA polymerase subunit H [Candidatus Woesearchaeota archaeon]|nr:DNA-directed RNA polymerase subunit H [Candidatus Woesearchaeota archaeon]
MTEKKFEITQHRLVPKHSVLSEKEVTTLLKNYSLKDLPKMHLTDPIIETLKAKEGDIIRIERNSLTAGKSVFYRRVIANA